MSDSDIKSLQQYVETLKQQVADLQNSMDNALAQSELRYQRIVANLPGVVFQFVLHPDGSFEMPYVSPGVTAIYGVTPEEAMAEPALIMNAAPEAYQERLQQSITDSATTLEPWVWESPARHRDGSMRWISATSRPARLADGSTVWDGVILDVTEQRRVQEQQERLLAIIASADDIISYATMDGVPQYMNPAGLKLMGLPLDTDIAARGSIGNFHPHWALEIIESEGIPAALQHGSWKGETAVIDAAGKEIPVSQRIIAHFDSEGIPTFLSTIMSDISDQRQMMVEREEFQERIINLQTSLIAELSTPLIPLNDDVMVLPLIGTIDSNRAQQMIETVLKGVSQQKSKAVIIDITGVSVIDTQVASVFMHLAQAVQLLGARVVLTGIRPEVAQTIVGLGLEFHDLVTRSDLQSGINYALKARR